MCNCAERVERGYGCICVAQCRIVVSGMSNTRSPSFNWLLIPLCAIVVGVLTMRLGVIELYLLFAYTVFVVAAHVHYGICVVRAVWFALLYTHADRQGVDISVTAVCVCVCVFVRLRISPPRIKLAASNFSSAPRQGISQKPKKEESADARATPTCM